MIDFHPITLADKATIENFTLRSKIRNCDLSFANMYCWQRRYQSAWAIVDGFLVIRFLIDGGEQYGYMQPIGEDGGLDFSHIIPRLAHDAHTHGGRLHIVGLTVEGRESLRRGYGKDFAFHSDPCFEDYIYSRDALKTLSGKKLQPKRNHINQFLKLYPDYEFRPLSSEIFDEALRLDCKWRASRGDLCSDMTPEREAMLRAFESFEELELQGGALYVADEMVAFTYGSAINSDTFCTHIEKGLMEFTGCYTMVNRLLAESLPENFTFINREEDLGVEGLRRAKLSYHPQLMQEKYTAIYLHHDESECKNLWQSVFGDDDEFVDEFIMHHFSSRRMLRMTDPDNRYLSMLHIIPFTSEIGRVAYIYGVATHDEARGRGYATTLMSSAMKMIEADLFDAALLIPSEEWLKGFYSKFGFKEGVPTTFSAYNNFDFGSGDTTKDISMVCAISNNAKRAIEECTSLHLTRV